MTKRDGPVVPFESGKIRAAIIWARDASEELGIKAADRLTRIVVKVLSHRHTAQAGQTQQFQDVVEQALISADHIKSACAYMESRPKVRILSASIEH